MDLKKDYRYYVVNFSHPPYSDIDQYVCIPDSWIQLREIVDQVVVAKFPVENLSITKKRVKDGEVFSDDWSIYVAEVKYGTDSYENAEKYIKTLKEKFTNKQSCSEPVNNGDTLSKLSKSLRRSKRSQSNRSVNKPQISEAPSNYSIEPVIQTNRVETIKTAHEAIKQTDASSESLHDEQLLSNTEHYLHEITIRQENNDEKLNNVDSIENDNGPQDIARNKSPANHDGPQLTNESLDATIISEPISDTGNLGQVKNASECIFEESLKLLDQTRDGFFQYCKSLEKLMDIMNNQYYCGSYTPFNPTINDAVVPVVEEKEREEKEIEKKRQVLKRTQAEIGIIKRRETGRNEQEIDDSADIEDAIKDAVAPVVEEKEREEKEIEKKRQMPKRTQAEIGIIKRREAERKEQEIDDSADIEDAIKDAVAPVVEEKERKEKEIEKKRQVLKRTQAEIGIIKSRKTERNKQEIDDSADIDNGDDDDKDDDDDDYVKRKRFQSRTLTLPPEYDKNDSKWTLRYREYAPELVELIEHTGVYINAVKLVNCKRLAKNSKTLARLLLVEIFTESALCTCSLTGVRAKAFDIDGTHIRPGLDENARTVLLTYVEEYAQASKWPKTDNQSILNSIRNKMQEIRFKRNK